jgi:hypothetical protein
MGIEVRAQMLASFTCWPNQMLRFGSYGLADGRKAKSQ